MDEILTLIGQWGVIPILIIIIYKMYLRVIELNKELKEKNEEIVKIHNDKNNEIRDIEKENVGLLYKCLAALKKITKDADEK